MLIQNNVKTKMFNKNLPRYTGAGPNLATILQHILQRYYNNTILVSSPLLGIS